MFLTISAQGLAETAAADNTNVATAAAVDTPSSDTSATKADKQLPEVVVTGSLIPTAKKESTTPVFTITNEDIQQKGFADIAEALQRNSYATGSIQDGQYVGGFTEGAKVVSLFGLAAQYTKFLIDGRPMATYPALYNGSDVVVSISGVPTQLIDHLDVLPGAQSSIYGSDAIAGLVNIVMKKNMDGPMIDGRYGWTSGGGASDRLIAIGDGFSIGNFDLVAGGQYESKSPMWGYQRSITSHYFAGNPNSPQTASRDFMVYGVYGQANGDNYYFLDPSNCANAAGLFGGSEREYTRVNHGSYCGTLNQGYYTVDNGGESEQAYLHMTYDVTETMQVFSDFLIDRDVARFSSGLPVYNSSYDGNSAYANYEDPSVNNQDYLNLQRIFAPEEAGGVGANMNQNTNNSVRATLGIKGDVGASDWKYLADFTYMQNKLTESINLFETDKVEAFFSNIYGQNLGLDPNLGTSMFTPNYAQFFTPITPAQWRSFDTDATSRSQTEESYARGQVTNSSLFKLPGGPAGLALQVEGGGQGWYYDPDVRFLDGQTFGYTAVAGSGHRSRYAGIAELKMPLVSTLTADISGRYDDYHVEGQNVSKFTYNLGLQYRPVEMLLLRGRYGTAFKMPTLADEFQGKSGAYSPQNDYYFCATQGYTGSNLQNCHQFQESVYTVTTGNTALRPINATVWDLGFILTPVERLNITFDYIHWAIADEVQTLDPDKLLATEAACRLGQLDINSPTCVDAVSKVTRDASDQIVSVLTPKENASHENLGVFTTQANYELPIGFLGALDFGGAFTVTKFHNFQQFAGDPYINLLNNPFYSREFKTKSNVSVTWELNPVSVTLYVERYGRSPNYISTTQPNGYSLNGGGTVAPWTLANLSVSYKPIKDLEVTLAANNVLNKMPPADNSYLGIETQPYDNFDYNIYGRTFYLTASYKPHFN